MIGWEIKMENKQSYKEEAQHGTQDFPFAYYGEIRRTWNDFYVPPHWHEEVEIICLLKGQAEVRIAEQTFLVKEKTVLFVPPNQLHHVYQVDNSQAELCSFVFHPAFVSSLEKDRITKDQLSLLLNDTPKSTFIIYPESNHQEQVTELIKEVLLFSEEQPDFFELQIKGLLLQLLGYLLLSTKVKARETMSQRIQKDRAKTVLRYINRHYHEKIQLADLAASVSLSKEQFSRFFKETFKQSPMHFLTQFRLQKTVDLLQTTEKTIAEIAQLTGFDTSNYLAACFKKYFQMTPSEFREMT